MVEATPYIEWATGIPLLRMELSSISSTLTEQTTSLK
jgi:hypothetical protein